MNATTDKEYAEFRKLLAETDNLIAETRKMQSETMKIQVEAQTLKLRHVVAAFVAAIVFVAAVVGLVKAFL